MSGHSLATAIVLGSDTEEDITSTPKLSPIAAKRRRIALSPSTEPSTTGAPESDVEHLLDETLTNDTISKSPGPRRRAPLSRSTPNLKQHTTSATSTSSSSASTPRLFLDFVDIPPLRNRSAWFRTKQPHNSAYTPIPTPPSLHKPRMHPVVEIPTTKPSSRLSLEIPSSSSSNQHQDSSPIMKRRSGRPPKRRRTLDEQQKPPTTPEVQTTTTTTRDTSELADTGSSFVPSPSCLTSENEENASNDNEPAAAEKAVTRRKRRSTRGETPPEDLAGGRCHQCRRGQGNLKMKCSAIEPDGLTCPILYCKPCVENRYDFAFNASSTTWSCPKSRNFCNCSHCLRKAGFAYILDMGKRRGKGEARGPNCKAPSVATQAKAKGYSSICRYLRSKGYGLGVEGEENKKQPDVEEEVIEETPPRDEVDPSPEKNMVNLPDEPEEEKIEINVTAHKRTLKLTLHTRPLPPKDQPSTSNGDSQRRRSIFDSPTELDDPLQSIDGEPSTPSLPPSSSPQEPTFSLPSPPPSSKYTFPMFSHDTTTVHGDPYSESHSLRQSYQEYLDAIPSSEIESFPFAHLASILGDGEDENDEDASATLGLYYKDSSPPALDTIIADHHTEGGASTSYPPTANTATLDLDLDLDTTTHIDITPQPELYPAYAAPSYLDTSDPNTSPTSAWEPTHTRAHTDDSTTLTLCPTFDGMEVTSHDSASSIGVGVVGEYDWSHAMMNPRLLRGAKFEDLGPTLVDSTVMVDDHIAEDFTF